MCFSTDWKDGVYHSYHKNSEIGEKMRTHEAVAEAALCAVFLLPGSRGGVV